MRAVASSSPIRSSTGLRVTTSFRTSQIDGMIETLQAALPLVGRAAGRTATSCCARANSRRAGHATGDSSCRRCHRNSRAITVAHARETRAAESTRNFQIAAQPLSQALLEFSRQADVIVTAPSELVRSKRAPEIRGELTPSVALARLLRGSGLEASFTASGAITIGAARRFARRPTPASEPAGSSASHPTQASDALIEEVLVTAQKRTENVQDVPVFGQRVRQPARAAAARDDDPRLRRLHSLV